jgi:hypothetical protein
MNNLNYFIKITKIQNLFIYENLYKTNKSNKPIKNNIKKN